MERGVEDLGPSSPRALFEHACNAFALSALEREIVETLLGAMVHGESPGRTVAVSDLATAGDLGGVTAALHESGVLVGGALVTIRGNGPMLARRIALHDQFWPRLVGAPLVGVPSPLAEPPRSVNALVLAPAIIERVREARGWLRARRQRWPALIIHGAPGCGRAAVGAALAAELGCGVLPLDGARLAIATLPEWRRELAWHQAVPVIADADRAEPAALAVLAEKFAGPLVMTATASLASRMVSAGRAVHVVELEALGQAERAAIWERALAHAVPDATLDTAVVARRFGFGPERIHAAVANLADSGAVVDTAAAISLCRTMPEVQVGGLATRLTTARWRDLVVPARVRGELELVLAWARGAPALDGQPGLACLFYGAPGTGKTLAARVIAGELGLDVYRVDLSQVVDKYIGESEKRLDQLFREAEAAGVVLFFDEADALFAQRTAVRDARDRYANLETSFLLQRIEAHPGLAILATNLIANIDPAFQRRLAIIVELRAPDRDERRSLWEKFLPPHSVRSADIDVDLLADRIAISGGDIRNAVFGAHLIASTERERLAMKHLAIAVWRELKKAGRVVDSSLLGEWEHAVIAYARTHG